ncbi:MAG: flagellar hook capping FlgD N-terminal domain-containing protein [Cellvibrio sp.]
MSNVLGVGANQNSYSIDDGIKQAVNVSDATQLENNFITLMVAQIQNQDPTSPLDSTEFLNQYSAMSQVKSLENMANVSKSNLVLMDNIQTLAASSLVGKDVSVSASSLILGDKPLSGSFSLNHNSVDTRLVLTDGLGQKTEVVLNAQSLGKHQFSINPQQLGLAPGAYSVAIETSSGESPFIEVKGRVNNVRVTTQGPELDIDGIGQVPFYNITEFGQVALNDLY